MPKNDIPDLKTLDYSRSNNPTAQEDLELILSYMNEPGFTEEEVSSSFHRFMKHWNVRLPE